MTKHVKSLTFRNLTLVCCLALLGALAGCSGGPESDSQPQPGKPETPGAGASMLEAAVAGNNARVQELLNKGVSANVQGPQHNTPIMEATFAGHLDTVKLLLDHGANLSMAKSDGATPIALAGKHKEIVELFKNVAALVEAASKGNNQAVSELISKGTPVNGIDQYGHSALTEASWNGLTETVKLLLDKGTDPTIQKSDGETALSLAASRKHPAIVDLLNQAIAKRAASTPTPAAK
jgi:uncharacterized protein